MIGSVDTKMHSYWVWSCSSCPHETTIEAEIHNTLSFFGNFHFHSILFCVRFWEHNNEFLKERLTFNLKVEEKTQLGNITDHFPRVTNLKALSNKGLFFFFSF